MTWATVTTGPDRDAPEQRRQPVGMGKDGEETGSLGRVNVWRFFWGGVRGGPEELCEGGSCAKDRGSSRVKGKGGRKNSIQS